MKVNEILKRVNKLLAGEQLVYSQIEEFLDKNRKQNKKTLMC